MKHLIPILSITGSDNTGGAGIQADIQTISALGCHPLTAITSITVQDSKGIESIVDMSCDMVIAQTRSAIENLHPQAVKIGFVRNSEVIMSLRSEVIGCRNIVSAPGIITSHGERVMDDAAVRAFVSHIVPITTLLLLRCNEAELMLGCDIVSNDDMLSAARKLCSMGAEAVMLRGGLVQKGMLTALLYIAENDKYTFFSSPNTEGWRMHGVSGALSSAIASRLALGDDIEDAVANAHVYMRNQVVYSSSSSVQSIRQMELYNKFVSLVSDNYSQSHNVNFYADSLSVTPRYLSQVTSRVAGKSPKQILADCLLRQADILLSTTSLSVQEIAFRLGFSSQTSFCKFFKQQRGCSARSGKNS